MNSIFDDSLFRCLVCGNDKSWGWPFEPKKMKCKFCGNNPNTRMVGDKND